MLLKGKLEQFYEDILKKRESNQKIRLQTDQEFHQSEIKSSDKRLKPNQLIKKTAKCLNKTRSAKQGFSPSQIDEKSLENNYFTDIYDFHRLLRVKEHEDRTVRYMEKQNDRKKRKLREPLDIGEKVLTNAKSLNKKDVPGVLYKYSTKNKPFFNRNEIFKINKRVGINSSKKNYYRVQKDSKRIKERYYRQELFALKGQFEQKNGSFIYLF